MKKRCKNIEAVARVICGNLSIMPTCNMKFTPLDRFSRSLVAGTPASMEGVRRSSSSVKSHCDSARKSSSDGNTGGCWDREVRVEVLDWLLRAEGMVGVFNASGGREKLGRSLSRSCSIHKTRYL